MKQRRPRASGESRRTMALPPQVWSILTVLTMLLAHFVICSADKPCTVFSSVGHVVHLDSSFQVFCTFTPPCEPSITVVPPNNYQVISKHNSTTIYLNVTRIKKNTTYVCKCEREIQPCGLDVIPGYPPAAPGNLSCIQDGVWGDVVCMWNRGRETHLRTSSVLRVRSASDNSTEGRSYPGVRSGSGWVRARFNSSASGHTVFSVWVNSSNLLGSVESSSLKFTLSDIVRPRPPVLTRAECLSRRCELRLEGDEGVQHLEVQYSADQGPRTRPLSISGPRTILSLEPYRLYEFRVRTRLRKVWSEWSSPISNRTQEEVPVRALDVWYSKSADQEITLHWKVLKDADARGRILGYEVIVHNLRDGRTVGSNTSDTRLSVPHCSRCEITVFGLNSKGRSPPGKVSIAPTTAQPPRNVSWALLNDSSIAITWRRPVTERTVLGYLVEWHPVDRQRTDIRWVRLGPEEHCALITGDDIRPYECYEGAVHVLYDQAVGGATLAGVHTLESAPTTGPFIRKSVTGDQVTVTWEEVPHPHRGGCVTHYNIYWRDAEAGKSLSLASTPKRAYSFEVQPGHTYSLWINASTSAGEGPAENLERFFVPRQEVENVYPVVYVVCSFFALVLFGCLCQMPSLRQRALLFFQCLLLDSVPDPANTKWAKECAKEKGAMALHMCNLKDCGASQEADSVEVQELPKENCCPPESPAQSTDTPGPVEGSTEFFSYLLNSPATDPLPLPYPQRSYIKSISQESDASDQASQETAVLYISAHGPGNIDEEEEDEEEDLGVLEGFFPCAQNIFMEPLMPFGGKLTLDAVRINCSEFLD